MANIVLTDDHVLLRKGLVALITNLGHTVLYEADNGKDLQNKIGKSTLPHIVLLDINMPVMDGYETAVWLKESYPKVKILALSMYDNEHAIIKMLASGAHGYILKDCDPAQLRDAITDLYEKGFYYSDLVSGKLMHAISGSNASGGKANLFNLTERELTFLQHTCSELTYKEIAEEMSVSPRTVDGYRDSLFEKLGIKTRVGLVLYAIKGGIVDVNC